MADPALTVTTLRTPADPTRVVVVMPGLGTEVVGTWDVAAEHLAADTQVIALDLPGHGRSPAWDSVGQAPSMAQVARAVDATVTADLERAGLSELPVHFAGISLAGGLALQLALEHAGTFSSTAVICSAAAIGQPATWEERAALVRSQGTEPLVDGSVARWFAPGLSSSHPEAVKQLTQSLRAADDESYALLCETLGTFDLTDRLEEITLPVLVVAGEHDVVATAADAGVVGARVQRSTVHVLSDVAHQAPTEKPAEVAGLLNDFFA